MDTEKTEKAHKYPMVEARYPVRLLTTQGPRRGETQIINTHGALIRCKQPLHPNETATISIELSEDEYLVAEGKSIWVEFNRSGGDNKITPSGMVVRFINLNRLNKLRLRNVIVRHYQRKLGVRVQDK